MMMMIKQVVLFLLLAILCIAAVRAQDPPPSGDGDPIEMEISETGQIVTEAQPVKRMEGDGDPMTDDRPRHTPP